MGTDAEGKLPEQDQPPAAVSNGGDDAADDEEHASATESTKKNRPFWVELPILIVTALGLAILIKTFAVQAFYIPSGSMQNTLAIGDRILVNKIVYHTRPIKHGDIVVFRGNGSWGDHGEAPSHASGGASGLLRDVGSWVGLVPDGTDYIKRVIGLPGDTVSCAGHGAPVMVNGHPLQETSYLFKGAGDDSESTTGQNLPSDAPFGPIKVPPGRLWVMGDHRAGSQDSRGHLLFGDPGQGTIPESAVVGRAFVVVWPLDHWKTLPIPKTFQHPALASTLAQSVPVTLGFAGALPVLWLTRRPRRGQHPPRQNTDAKHET